MLRALGAFVAASGLPEQAPAKPRRQEHNTHQAMAVPVGVHSGGQVACSAHPFAMGCRSSGTLAWRERSPSEHPAVGV